MSDIKLYRMAQGGVSELVGGAVALEKSLQNLFEANLAPVHCRDTDSR